jgi:hypothetical protein
MDTIFGAGAYKARSHPLSPPFPFNSKGEIVRKFQICPKPDLETAIGDVTRILSKDLLECGTAEFCGKYKNRQNQSNEKDIIWHSVILTGFCLTI